MKCSFKPAAFCGRPRSSGNTSISLSLRCSQTPSPQGAGGAGSRQAGQHGAHLLGLSTLQGQTAVGFAVRKSTNESLQCLSTNSIPGSGKPSNVMLTLAIIRFSRGSCGHPKLTDGENLHPTLGLLLSYGHHRDQLPEDKHKHNGNPTARESRGSKNNI